MSSSWTDSLSSEVLLRNPLQFFDEYDVSYLYPSLALILILAILLLLILVLKGKKKGTKGNLFILSGISNAGKTSLYIRLRYGSLKNTVSSLAQNEGKFSLVESETKAEKHLVDYPGHEELKNKLMLDYLPKARAIIFVVDAVLFPSEIKEVASYFYSILMQKDVNELEIPILVACNKSEMISSSSCDTIKSKLATELNELRETRSAMPGVLGENQDDEEQFYLGYENQPFQFSQLPFSVEFASCSVTEPSLRAITSFIDNN